MTATCSASRGSGARRWTSTGVDLERGAFDVLRHPTVASKRFLITIGDRTVGGLTHRDQMVGPWQVPVADCAVTLADFTRLRGRGDGHGRTHAAGARRRAGLGPHGGGRGDHQPAGRADRAAARQALRQLDGRLRRGRAKTPRCTTPSTRSGWSCARRSASACRSARTRCRCARGGATPAPGTAGHRAGVADRHRLRHARRRARHADAAAAAGRHDAGAGRPRRGPRPHGRLDAGAGARASSATTVPDLDDPQRLVALVAAINRPARARACLAYHDRSDGGLWAAVCEMAFAGPGRRPQRRHPRSPRRRHRDSRAEDGSGRRRSASAERATSCTGRGRCSREHGLGDLVSTVGRTAGDRRVAGLGRRRQAVFDEPLRDLHQAWDEVSWRIAPARQPGLRRRRARRGRRRRRPGPAPSR